jgi:hypothetical protein
MGRKEHNVQFAKEAKSTMILPSLYRYLLTHKGCNPLEEVAASFVA